MFTTKSRTWRVFGREVAIDMRRQLVGVGALHPAHRARQARPIAVDRHRRRDLQNATKPVSVPRIFKHCKAGLPGKGCEFTFLEGLKTKQINF